MAASVNPGDGGSPSSSMNGGSPNNGGGSGAGPTPTPPQQAAADNSSGHTQTQAVLRHNPGLSSEWTPDEQSTLDELLLKHASDSIIVRYAKIALRLKDKTVRDVALRCRWMTKKENGKRRKEDHNSARKSKDRKERVMDPSAKSSSHLTPRPNGTPYAPPMVPMDNDDGISYQAIGGATGQLLEQNSQIFNQISSNIAAFQIHDNITLFCQARDNIHKILNDLNDMPEVMRQMPPLPVKLNDELANSILPRPSLQKKS
ncbi:uncharacterized protein LOC131156372 [Malania oleifera]|uniref:uncharacterized protein LOC131156372 n=1 Tax=Malania oleifera TaxID=397392 RepID=UPI0025AE0184|nr:uncharacterized protein LOC131156372 [Malania oleifera]